MLAFTYLKCYTKHKSSTDMGFHTVWRTGLLISIIFWTGVYSMYSDAMCRYAVRVIIVELTARVILTRSGICAVHTVVPKENANGCFSAATLA